MTAILFILLIIKKKSKTYFNDIWLKVAWNDLDLQKKLIPCVLRDIVYWSTIDFSKLSSVVDDKSKSTNRAFRKSSWSWVICTNVDM